mmetsp:Transcript_23704/g.67310  ORF Transcript_23704/g.67310 Transcript_23704/m.67310 type:complete len:409 (-) Transcript_23704:500-1726(-)
MLVLRVLPVARGKDNEVTGIDVDVAGATDVVGRKLDPEDAIDERLGGSSDSARAAIVQKLGALGHNESGRHGAFARRGGNDVRVLHVASLRNTERHPGVSSRAGHLHCEQLLVVHKIPLDGGLALKDRARALRDADDVTAAAAVVGVVLDEGRAQTLRDVSSFVLIEGNTVEELQARSYHRETAQGEVGRQNKVSEDRCLELDRHHRHAVALVVKCHAEIGRLDVEASVHLSPLAEHLHKAGLNIAIRVVFHNESDNTCHLLRGVRLVGIESKGEPTTNAVEALCLKLEVSEALVLFGEPGLGEERAIEESVVNKVLELAPVDLLLHDGVRIVDCTGGLAVREENADLVRVKVRKSFRATDVANARLERQNTIDDREDPGLAVHVARNRAGITIPIRKFDFDRFSVTI